VVNPISQKKKSAFSVVLSFFSLFQLWMWEKEEAWQEWASLSEACYMLRSNINDWDGERLWHAYIQLTEAEAAFRVRVIVSHNPDHQSDQPSDL
jgi:hypothetical protein